MGAFWSLFIELSKISHKFFAFCQVYPQIFTQPSERMSGRSTPRIPNLRVLVVDDDVLCLKIVTKMLQKCGYTGTFLVRIVLVFYVLRRSIFRKALISKLRKKTATPVGELFLRIVYREDSSSRSGRIQKSCEELNASDSYGRFWNLLEAFLHSRMRGGATMCDRVTNTIEKNQSAHTHFLSLSGETRLWKFEMIFFLHNI